MTLDPDEPDDGLIVMTRGERYRLRAERDHAKGITDDLLALMAKYRVPSSRISLSRNCHP